MATTPIVDAGGRDGRRPAAVRRRVPAFRRDSRLLILPALAFQITFFFVPLVMVARESLFDPDLTGAHYGEVFTNPVYRKVLLQTLRLAVIVTTIAVALGYPVAYFIARARPFVAAITLLGSPRPVCGPACSPGRTRSRCCTDGKASSTACSSPSVSSTSRCR